MTGGYRLILFTLFSIPLTYLIVNAFYNNNNIKKRVIVLPFVFGMILSIPILLLYWSFFQSFFNNWTTTGLFFYYFFNRDGIIGLYIVIVIYLLFTFVEKKQKESQLREITAYFMGLFFTIAIYDSLVAESWYGMLELFLIPITRLSSILLISLFIAKSLKKLDWQKYLLLGFALLVPVLMVFVPVMFVSNLILISIIISILIFGGSAVLYLLELKGRLHII